MHSHQPCLNTSHRVSTEASVGPRDDVCTALTTFLADSKRQLLEQYFSTPPAASSYHV